MELRYCEMCGDIINVQEGEKDRLTDRYLCDRCAAKEREAEAKQEEKAEDVCLRSSAKEEQSREVETQQAGQEQARRHSESTVAKEISLGGLLASNKLDLYSSDTVARKREETRTMDAMAEAKKTGTRTKIRLLDPEELSSKAKSEDAGDPCEQTELMHGPAPKHAASSEGPEAKGQAGVAGVTAAAKAGASPAGIPEKAAHPDSDEPEPPARRIQFPCPACQVTLAVNPVSKLTRLRCPRCRSRMTIDSEENVRLSELGTQTIPEQKTNRPAHGDLLNAPLTSGQPSVAPGGRRVAGPGARENVITCRSAADLCKLARQSSMAVGRQDSLSDDELDNQKTVIAPARPAETPRRLREKEPDDWPPAPEEELSLRAGEELSATSAAAKGLLLGVLVALPFCAWAGLLAWAGPEAFNAYVQPFGDIVREVLKAAFGG